MDGYYKNPHLNNNWALTDGCKNKKAKQNMWYKKYNLIFI